MARIRTIKPEFPHSESMGRVSRDARLLYIMLWTIADDEGRGRAASRMLASLLFPYDDDAPRYIPEWLMELEREKAIVVYHIEENLYFQIIKWTDHQKIDRPTKSRLPAPPERKKPRVRTTRAREDSRECDEGSSEDLDQGREGTKDQVSFEDFWRAYPRREAKGAALKAFENASGKATPEVLVKAAAAYAARRAHEDAKFTKMPATWLNQECWLDEAASAPNGATIHVLSDEVRQKEQENLKKLGVI